MENKELNESLKRHKELLGYDLKKGTSSLTERRHMPYTDYAEDTEGSENTDFDFGGDQGGEDTGGGDEGGNEDFDFGGEDTGNEGGDEGSENTDFDFGGETEEETDEFGTADEFSAADDIETDEGGDVEEIDVTDIVKRADDAKDYAEKAVSAAEEGTSMIKDLMSKFQELEKSLGAINTIGNEVTSIKKDLQAQKPKEKLELRSLDSYPFNVKLTDYWNDEKLKDNYEITDGSQPDAQSPDGQVNVWKVTPEDTKDWNKVDIQKSFIPESKNKKKRLRENDEQTSLNFGEEGENTNNSERDSLIEMALFMTIITLGMLEGHLKNEGIIDEIKSNGFSSYEEYYQNEMGDNIEDTINMLTESVLKAKEMGADPEVIEQIENRIQNIVSTIEEVNNNLQIIPESRRKKKVLTEINKGKLGSYASYGIAMAAVITLGVSVTDVDVTNADGSTRNAEIGETFTGVIEDMGQTKSAGIVVTVKTDKGETVEFHYYSTAYNFKIGSKVKLKIEKDKTFYFMPDVKMSNESRSKRKKL